MPATPTPSAARADLRPSTRRPRASARAPRFEEVYAENAPFVGRSLRRLGVPDASIEDALQDVFVVVHRQLSAFEGISSVRTWLYAIALRVARDVRRRLKRKGGCEPLDDSVADPTSDPAGDVANREALRVVQALLERLDDEKREVFVMAELEQMSIPEMAAILNVNHNTLYARLRAARIEFERLAALARRRMR